MLQVGLASGSEHPCEARSTVVGVPYPPGMGDSTTVVTADPVEPAALTEARPDPDTGSTEPAPEPGKDTGPAGPSLSPSRAGDFLTCPLLYRFRVIDRLPEPPSPAAARGTLVHAVLERLFDHPAAARPLAPRAAVGAAHRGRARAHQPVRHRRAARCLAGRRSRDAGPVLHPGG